MSEWQSPQDYPRRETDGIKRLVDAVASTHRQVRESTSNLLRTAGIYVSEAGMRVARSLLVEGDFASTGSADIDGTLNVDAEMTVGGDATFSGAMRIEGTLSLPAGIIDNDALANPIRFEDAVGSSAGIGYSTTYAALAVCTLPIPPGFSRFTFSGSSVARCYNTSGATVYLYVQTFSKVVGSDAFWGSACQDAIATGFQSTVAAPHSATHSIPPGATQVQVWASVRATAPIAADPTNFAGIEGVAFFSR